MMDQRTEIGSQLTYDLSSKDLIIYLPLMGSSLALTWEVGSFFPIHGSVFGMFSLSEHLVFAFQGLPLAIVSVVFILILYAQSVINRRFFRPSFARKWFYFAGELIGLALGIGLGIYLAVSLSSKSSADLWSTLSVVGVLSVGFSVHMFMIWTDFRYIPKSKVVQYLWIAVYIVIFTFVMGAFQTQAMIVAGPISVIETTSASNELIVLRASQTLLVGYDRKAKSFVLLKQEDIKRRAWLK
jgi:hypothetical protein